jgi:hypothetical protein
MSMRTRLESSRGPLLVAALFLGSFGLTLVTSSPPIAGRISQRLPSVVNPVARSRVVVPPQVVPLTDIVQQADAPELPAKTLVDLALDEDPDTRVEAQTLLALVADEAADY